MNEIVTVDVLIDKEDAVKLRDWEKAIQSILRPLAPIDIQRFPNPYALTFVYNSYPQELDQQWARARTLGFYGSIWVKREYDNEELLKAQFLEFKTKAVVDSVPGTLHWRMVPLCPYCGFQESFWDFENLRIKDESDGFQIAKVDWHPIVASASLADRIRDEGYTSVELIPLPGGEASSWYAIRAKNRLPPLQSPPTQLKRLPTATLECQLDHDWEYPKSQFFYAGAGFHGSDFNETHELFGDPQSASRAFVISNRVYRMMVDSGVAGLACEPIQLIE